MGIGVVVTTPVAGRLTGRVGPRWPMISGLVICASAMFGLLRLGTARTGSAEWWDFALAGVGAGLALPPMTATVVAAVRPERAGMASAVHNAMRQLGQVLGVAVLGTLVFAGVGNEVGARRLDPAHAQ